MRCTLTTKSLTVDPTRYAALADFCCGTSRDRPELEVDKLVADFHAGRRDDAEFRVTESSSGALVGVAGIALHIASLQHPRLVESGDYGYVSFVGLSQHFRRGGKNNPRPGKALGDVLLRDALAQIEQKWGARIRGVLAQAPRESYGFELADRHGFDEELIYPEGPEYNSWYRRLSR